MGSKGGEEEDSARRQQNSMESSAELGACPGSQTRTPLTAGSDDSNDSRALEGRGPPNEAAVSQGMSTAMSQQQTWDALSLGESAQDRRQGMDEQEKSTSQQKQRPWDIFGKHGLDPGQGHQISEASGLDPSAALGDGHATGPVSQSAGSMSTGEDLRGSRLKSNIRGTSGDSRDDLSRTRSSVRKSVRWGELEGAVPAESSQGKTTALKLTYSDPDSTVSLKSEATPDVTTDEGSQGRPTRLTRPYGSTDYSNVESTVPLQREAMESTTYAESEESMSRGRKGQGGFLADTTKEFDNAVIEGTSPGCVEGQRPGVKGGC